VRNGGLGRRTRTSWRRWRHEPRRRYATSSGGRGIAKELARSHAVNAAALHADVADEQQVNDLVARTVEDFGSVDVLVNDAAYNKWIPFDRLDELTTEIWDFMMAVNLKGPFMCMRAVGPHMKRQGAGRRQHSTVAS